MKNQIKRIFNREVIILFAGMLFLSLIINITRIDVYIQSLFFSQDAGWILKKAQPWDFIYHYSYVPPLIVSIFSFFLLGRSFIDIKTIKYRKIAAFLVLVMALGPGLFVNLILKENWGRPRPRDIQEFNGKYAYEEVLTIDTESKGKSFPCGHCSMGFFTFAFFFIFRKRKTKLAILFLMLSFVMGGLIGFARIVQGGHFFSDALWAGFVTYFVTSTIYYILGLDKNVYYETKNLSNFKKYHSINILMYILMVVLAFLVMLATPYNKSKLYRIKKIEPSQYNSINAELGFLKTDLLIQGDSLTTLEFAGEGFGFPKSRIKNNWDYELVDSQIDLTFKQRKSGFFTELTQHNDLDIDYSKEGFYVINIENSLIEIDTSSFPGLEIILSDTETDDPKSVVINSDQIVKRSNNHYIIGDSAKILLTINYTNSKVMLK